MRNHYFSVPSIIVFDSDVTHVACVSAVPVQSGTSSQSQEALLIDLDAEDDVQVIPPSQMLPPSTTCLSKGTKRKDRSTVTSSSSNTVQQYVNLQEKDTAVSQEIYSLRTYTNLCQLN